MTVKDPEVNMENDIDTSGDEGNQTDTSVESNQTKDDSEGNFNAGWADCVSKILNSKKPKGKKCLVLSRAKKLTAVKKSSVKPAGFEIQTAQGEIKEEIIETGEKDIEPTVKKKKKELPNLRVKPDILAKDRERTLQKIATKGVVQLFNAVKMQQKDITKKLEEAGPLEVRKEKVLKNIDKRAFLDVLMGEKSEHIEDQPRTQQKQDTNWSVLKDDFMMSAKLKDWDKELEEEQENEYESA